MSGSVLAAVRGIIGLVAFILATAAAGLAWRVFSYVAGI